MAQVVQTMDEINASSGKIGNIIGVRRGREDAAAVMFGSHIDTVGTGGRYDGLYGVVAGLEACLDDIEMRLTCGERP